MLTAYVVVRIHGTISSQAALVAFFESPVASIGKAEKPESVRPVDFRLWSQNRIAAYKHLLATKLDKPLVVLVIPKLRLEVPVFDGTDDVTLNGGGPKHG